MAQQNENQQSRLARQDLLRRRDINLYTGLHPRLLHGQQNQQNAPSLSLFSHKNDPQKAPRVPCRAFPSAASTNAPQMPSPSSFNIYSTSSTPLHQSAVDGLLPPASNSCSNNNNNKELSSYLNLGAKQKKVIPNYTLDDDSDEELEDGVLPPEFTLDQLGLNPKSNCSSRRSSLKDEDSLFPHKCKKKPISTLEDILGIQPESGIFSNIINNPEESITRVYRAEIPHLPLSTKLPAEAQQSNQVTKPRPVVEEPIIVKKPQVVENPPEPKTKTATVCKSDILLGALLRTCERNRHFEEAGDKSRLRSFSENIAQYAIEPLDLSFDAASSKDWSEDEEEEDIPDPGLDSASRRSSFSSDCHVPTPDECASFRQSFDSATSMVFHHKTGLPLTSSPAPLRRGRDKFDFDDSITSPFDIKKALFAKKCKALNMTADEDNKENTLENDHQPNLTIPIVSKTSDSSIITKRRERRPSKKLLSASAPATLTSNNLLGSFEESVLNGRLEPNSTVEGFTAEIGASGSFQPKHKTLPVTVFFYTLCDNAAYSSPYLGMY